MDDLTPEIVEQDLEEWPDEAESELIELPEEEMDEVAGGQSSAAILE